jgi:diguanylate cyclase (GGDEF)-like protein/PAS domain S-box-containing protein
MSSGPTPTAVLRAGALEETLSQFDALVGSPFAGIEGTAMAVLDAELGLLRLHGTAWVELGVDPDAAVGQPVQALIPANVLATALPKFRAVLRGERCSFSLPLSERLVHWVTAVPLRQGSGPVEGVLAVSWDQTASRRAEELYRVIAENSTDIVTRHDADGHYLYASTSMESAMGWEPEALAGMSCFDLIHPEDLERAASALRGGLARAEVVTVDYRFRKRDGTYVWVETIARAVPVWGSHGLMEFQCSSRDVTARRRAEGELGRRLAQQSAVARLGEMALQRTDLDALQREACRLVTETLDVELAYALEHRGGARMRVRAAHGWPDGTLPSEFEVSSFGGPSPGDRYAAGAVVIDDLPNDTSLRALPLRANDVVSTATVLIGERGAPVGLLGVHSRSRRRFGPEDVDFLHTVAHVIAGAIDRVRAEERIRHDALHDALTGLPNRTLLLDRLRIALARAERDGTRIAVLFLDLDRLKVLNDSLGHQAGDELLRAVGPRLQCVLRPADTLARFGGDEFGVLIEGVLDEQDALRVAERIVAAFEAPFEIDGEHRHGSISVGVVVTDPARGSEAGDLLSNADAAMYRAKELGRGRAELFDAGLRDRITARLRLEQDLRRALDGEGRLWLAYQPVWALPDRRLAGVEALLRWDHPRRGNIEPSQFIPVAEESGLIVELGERVLREACCEIARLRACTPATELKLTVNVSARQMGSPEIVDTVASALTETGLPATALALEITEGLLLEETPATVQTIEAIQQLGVRLILDDFGTGYSSLRYVQRYPLQGLKIDRAFVAGLGNDGAGDGAIVKAIVGMAHGLGMYVVPEGVETEAQLIVLERLGCDFAQGFHLARPLAPAQLEAWLLAGGRPGA